MNAVGLTQSSEEFVLVNIVEEIVREKVREAVRETGGCPCRKCELNACALALNALAPKYVTTERGRLLARVGLMNPDYLMKVSIEVAKALKVVRERPLH
ncbi:competence protein ComFB [Sporobacter termitidis DSM 10068]|uniref:Competence protein ComFB n=1 Tax=Sporobacter termitidis DSM 10068 TaxID=1123282 RepID=A0A1M5WH95_9FIRM|nr:late competence development ComFB family protein [Sporobacter termitidis]SHH86845.1 competence protein ComFB [Sporobacter termitidis DSM 10068]